MAEGNAACMAGRSASSSSCRGGRGAGGCGLALGRLVRKLRRRSKMLCAAAAGARPAAASRYCQYDPLSYARNFDRNGFGAALDDDDVSGHLYHYTFASRFVLASSSAGRQPQ